MEGSGSEVRRRFEQHKSRQTVNLVTVGRRTGLPRPVTVWFIFLGNRLFVRTSNRTDWCRNLKTTPKVNAKIDDLAFSAEAEQVRDEDTIRRLGKAYEESS